MNFEAVKVTNSGHHPSHDRASTGYGSIPGLTSQTSLNACLHRLTPMHIRLWCQTRNRPMPLTSSVVEQMMARFRNLQCVSHRCKDLFKRKILYWYGWILHEPAIGYIRIPGIGLELANANYIHLFLMIFHAWASFVKLVPVQYREYEYGLFSDDKRKIIRTVIQNGICCFNPLNTKLFPQRSTKIYTTKIVL